jgi:hypothetical protein
MTNKHLKTLFILICIFIIYSLNTEAQYLVGQSAFGNGGSSISGSEYGITGTLGQSVTGITTGLSNNEYSGFWYQENSIPTGVEKNLQNDLSKEYNLAQNYPNPFNPSTIITYSVPKTCLVTLKVYNILGKEVATLVNGQKTAGNYSVQFSAKGGSAPGGNAGNLASGIYFYRMQSGNFVQTKKLILLK